MLSLIDDSCTRRESSASFTSVAVKLLLTGVCYFFGHNHVLDFVPLIGCLLIPHARFPTPAVTVSTEKESGFELHSTRPEQIFNLVRSSHRQDKHPNPFFTRKYPST